MIAWLEGIKNLEDINKGVPVTGTVTGSGTLFSPDQFRRSVDSDEENNYDKICNETGELLSKDTYRAVPSQCDFLRTCRGGARYLAIAKNSLKFLRIEYKIITSS
jgi:hypothetical protein